MTTSELLVQAARRIGFGGGTLGSDRRLYEVLLQEADRLDGLEESKEFKIVDHDFPAAIPVPVELDEDKPKPEKIEEIRLIGLSGVRDIESVVYDGITTLNTLIRDYNERKGL